MATYQDFDILRQTDASCYGVVYNEGATDEKTSVLKARGSHAPS